MTIRSAFGLTMMLLFLAVASCATVENRSTTQPPTVRVAVVGFFPSTGLGIATEIDFSVVNLTDRELRNLTLTVDTNPSDGIDVPFTETSIDLIPPHGSWAPDAPFLVRGRRAGETAIFFIVSKDGNVLGKDYALVNVAPGK